MPTRDDTAAPRAGALIRYTIDGRLTLAGQPQPDDWARLRDEGFAVVINMRSDPERAAAQRGVALAAGLRYLHLPLPAYLMEPEHLEQFHQTMLAQAGPIFLHCRSATRVALLWLLERMVYDGWPRERGLATLRAAGYDDEALEVFDFCADDYFERAGAALRSTP